MPGIEFREGTPEAAKLISFINDEMLKGDEEEDSAGLGCGDEADLDYGIEAAGAGGDPVCAGQQAQDGDAGAQGQHPEVYRGRVPRVGI